MPACTSVCELHPVIEEQILQLSEQLHEIVDILMGLINKLVGAVGVKVHG